MHIIGSSIGSLARSIEDRLSWNRVISRDADLYGKRTRHWFTTDPVSYLFTDWTMWLLVSIGELNHVPPPVDLVFVQCNYPLLFLLAVQMILYVTIATVTTCFDSLRLAQRNPTAWLCLILVLVLLPAMSAMGPTR